MVWELLVVLGFILGWVIGGLVYFCRFFLSWEVGGRGIEESVCDFFVFFYLFFRIVFFRGLGLRRVVFSGRCCVLWFWRKW